MNSDIPFKEVRLTKLATLPEAVVSDNPPRTESIEGVTFDNVVPGMPLRVLAESLTEGHDGRSWTTSPVQKILRREEKRVFFTTKNSLYVLHFLDSTDKSFRDLGDTEAPGQAQPSGSILPWT